MKRDAIKSNAPNFFNFSRNSFFSKLTAVELNMQQLRWLSFSRNLSQVKGVEQTLLDPQRSLP
jgi:hypothetical protein